MVWLFLGNNQEENMNQYDLVTQTALVAGDDINQWEGYDGVTDSANEIAKIAGFSAGVRIFLWEDAKPAYFKDGSHFDLVLNPDDADILGKEGFKSYFAKIVMQEFVEDKEADNKLEDRLVSKQKRNSLIAAFCKAFSTVCLAGGAAGAPLNFYFGAAAFLFLVGNINASLDYSTESSNKLYGTFTPKAEAIKNLTIIEQGEVTEEGGKLLLWAQREASNRAFKATTRVSNKEQFLEYLSKDFTTQENQPQQVAIVR